MDNFFDPLVEAPEQFDEEFVIEFEKFLERLAEAVDNGLVDEKEFLREISDRLEQVINMRENGP